MRVGTPRVVVLERRVVVRRGVHSLVFTRESTHTGLKGVYRHLRLRVHRPRRVFGGDGVRFSRRGGRRGRRAERRRSEEPPQIRQRRYAYTAGPRVREEAEVADWFEFVSDVSCAEDVFDPLSRASSDASRFSASASASASRVCTFPSRLRRAFSSATARVSA